MQKSMPFISALLTYSLIKKYESEVVLITKVVEISRKYNICETMQSRSIP